MANQDVEQITQIRGIALNQRIENTLGRHGIFNFGADMATSQLVVVQRRIINDAIDRARREEREDFVFNLPEASKYFLKIIFNHVEMNWYFSVYEHYDFNLASIRRVGARIIIKNVLRDILKGLIYIHSHNIAHRMISPESIVVCYINFKYVGKIADISMSKSMLSNGKNTATSGNFEENDFSAPELIRHNGRRTAGRRMMNVKSDMHSYGSTVFNTITGEHLYQIGERTIPENICNPRFKRNFDILRSSEMLQPYEVKLFEHMVTNLTEFSLRRRPSANLALNSPYFWDSNTIKSLFNRAFEVISIDEAKITMLNLKLDSFYENWKNELAIERSIDFQEYSNNSYGLLQFIVNTINFPTLPAVEMLLSTFDGPIDYILAKIPNILCHIFQHCHRYKFNKKLKTFYTVQTSSTTIATWNSWSDFQ